MVMAIYDQVTYAVCNTLDRIYARVASPLALSEGST